MPEEPDAQTLQSVAAAAAAELPVGAAVVLHFVGHPPRVAETLRQLAPASPVIDLGAAALGQLEGLARA